MDSPSFDFSFGDLNNDSTTRDIDDKDTITTSTTINDNRNTCGAVLNNFSSFEFDFDDLDNNAAVTTFTVSTNNILKRNTATNFAAATSTAQPVIDVPSWDNITPIKKQKRFNYDLITGSVTKPRKVSKSAAAQTPLQRNNTMPLSLMYQSSLLGGDDYDNDDNDPYKSVNKSDETDQRTSAGLGSPPPLRGKSNSILKPTTTTTTTTPATGIHTTSPEA